MVRPDGDTIADARIPNVSSELDRAAVDQAGRRHGVGARTSDDVGRPGAAANYAGTNLARDRLTVHNLAYRLQPPT